MKKRGRPKKLLESEGDLADEIQGLATNPEVSGKYVKMGDLRKLFERERQILLASFRQMLAETQATRMLAENDTALAPIVMTPKPIPAQPNHQLQIAKRIYLNN